MNAPLPDVLSQHLIDPEICIRCNTCEDTCPVDAITHDSRNYVVDASICNGCMACVPPCPTGSIDNWRTVIRVEAYSVQEQLGWDVLPEQKEIAVSASAEGNLTDASSVTPESAVAGRLQQRWTRVRPRMATRRLHRFTPCRARWFRPGRLPIRISIFTALAIRSLLPWPEIFA